MSLVVVRKDQPTVGWGIGFNAYKEREKGKDARAGRPNRLINFAQVTGGSRIRVKSRNSVAAQQRIVNVQGWMPKHELQLRRTETGGILRNMYAPPPRSEKELDAQTGMLCIFVAKEGGSMRTNVTNYSQMRVIINTAGLSKSLHFTRPGVIRGKCFVSDKNSPDLITVTIKGVQTVPIMCSMTYHAGDPAAIDLNGSWVSDGDGNVVPEAIPPVGLEKDTPYLVMRSIPTENSNAMIYLGQDAVNAKFATTDFYNSLIKCKTAEELMALLVDVCDDIFNKRYCVAEDMPIRGYTLVWSTWRLIKMLQVMWARIKLPASYNHAQGVAMAYRTMLLVLKAAEDKFPRLVSAYPVNTPIEGPSTSPYQALLSRRESICSNELQQLFVPSTTGDSHTLARLQEGIARVDMYAVHTMHLFLDENRHWFESYYAGRFLSSGRGHEQADVLFE